MDRKLVGWLLYLSSVFTHLPVGNAVVDILYGTVNPSGRLPYSQLIRTSTREEKLRHILAIAKQVTDYGASIGSGTINYSEGLNVDYRYATHFCAPNVFS